MQAWLDALIVGTGLQPGYLGWLLALVVLLAIRGRRK